MKPDFAAYAIAEFKQGEEKKTKWREIGAAFAHKDGKGFDVLLDALPVSGRVTLRKIEEKQTTEEGDK